MDGEPAEINSQNDVPKKHTRRTFLKLATMTAATELLNKIQGRTETPAARTTAKNALAPAALPAPDVLPMYDNSEVETWSHEIDGRTMFFLPFSLLHAEPWAKDGKNFNVATNSFVDAADITESDSLLRQTGALSDFGLDTFVSPDFVQRNPKFLSI